MEKLKMHSPDLVAGNIEKIAALFPNCITEAKDAKGKITRAVDFDLLRQELSGSLVEGAIERYHIDWPGKRKALLHSNAPIAKTIRPVIESEGSISESANLFIEGENLSALKLLQETYLSKIKVVFIDPPYNTGDDLIYDDDYTEDTQAYLLKSNQKDEDGLRLVSNPEANGRFHSNWLSMMLPRLRLAKNLMDEDGVICVAISDIELSNAKALLSEVFGEANYVNTVNVLAKVAAGASGGGEDKRLKKNIEYVLVYAKRFDCFNTLTHLYTKRPLMEGHIQD